MTIRYRLGDLLADVADWLRYGPTPPTCARPGCGYYPSAGIHEPAETCALCAYLDPGDTDHHRFEPRTLPARVSVALRRWR